MKADIKNKQIQNGAFLCKQVHQHADGKLSILLPDLYGRQNHLQIHRSPTISPPTLASGLSTFRKCLYLQAAHILFPEKRLITTFLLVNIHISLNEL